MVGERVKVGTFDSSPAIVMCTTVDSWQPTLKWETFPGAADWRLDPTRSLSRAAQIRYELRIWREVNGWPGELVYERTALPAAEHRVEKPLAPGTKYYWSVRARFEIDGLTRVNRWGFALYPYSGWYGTSRSAWAAGRVDLIPGPNYYRFQTPEL